MAVQVSVQEENKAVYRRWVGMDRNTDLQKLAEEVISPDYAVHANGRDDLGQGVAGAVAAAQAWLTGFPDGRFDVEHLIAENDLTAARLIWRGTHTGTFLGIPPSGKEVAVPSVGIERIRHGKITESWREFDMLGLMEQIGVIPAQAQGEILDDTSDGGVRARPSNSTPDQNKQAMIEYVKGVNAVAAPDWDWKRANAQVDEERYLWHSAAWGAQRIGHDMKTYQMVKEAIPDLAFIPDVDIMVGEGDMVATRGKTVGHHTGAPLFGIPASGRDLVWYGIDISRFYDGKIVERWVCADILGLFNQIQGH